MTRAEDARAGLEAQLELRHMRLLAAALILTAPVAAIADPLPICIDAAAGTGRHRIVVELHPGRIRSIIAFVFFCPKTSSA